ncbi:MAG: hypothetical protein IPQ07_31380 [Myxococcales bacterium]|nr:hypothetical protein [Myxococcales bacterium]
MIARRALVLLLPVVVQAIGCGDTPARVTLDPVPLPASCGRPKNATGIRLTAYTATGEITRAVGLTEVVDLADFPASTEQFGVEVAVGGGAIGAIGKTAPLAFGDLEDKTVIPIVMAPPNGYCETAGFLTVARQAPLVARAGAGALIVGGKAADGTWLPSAEYYDPATATFTPVAVSSVLGASGFAGTSLVTLPDGRVAISGGPRSVITIFDPVTRTLGESVLVDSRAFHTSIALGDDRLLLAGGCVEVANGTCNGFLLNSSQVYDTKKIDAGQVGPVLRVARIGASPFSLGILDDGKPWYVLAGGTAPPTHDPTGADRISPDGDVETITGMNAQIAALDGGALITAFAPDGDLPVQQASMLAPGAKTARATALAPLLSGMRLAPLEDGRVAGFGGEPNDDVVIYDPTIDRWQLLAPPAESKGPSGLVAPTLLRLADGTVLVFDGGAATQIVHLYRPTLVGPAAGSTTVAPGGTPTVLTAPDPDTVQRGLTWDLVSPGDLARALVGGPRIATGSVRATVRVRLAGVALIADQVGPGKFLVGELAEGAKARIVRHDGGTTRILCSGKDVAAFDPNVAVTARLELSGTTAKLFRDDVEVASCDVGQVERGSWGVAALGPGGRVTVDTVTVAR